MDEKLGMEHSIKCIVCKDEPYYSEKYDSEYCLKCDKWLIDCCDGGVCEFCSIRPGKPSDQD